MNALPPTIIRLIFGYANTDPRYSISKTTIYDDIEYFRDIVKEDLQFYKKHRIFLAACEANNLGLAKYLKTNLSLSRHECLGYNLEELKPETIEHVIEVSTLFVIGRNDNIEVLSWLINEFKITHDEIRMDGYLLYSVCCGYGSINIVTYLSQKVPPNNDRLLTAFNSSCRWGQLEICEFLLKTYGVNTFDALDDMYTILELTLANGYLKTAQFLLKHYKFQDREIIILIFQRIACRGNLEILEWYANYFNISKEDIEYNNHSAYRSILSSGNVNAVKWMRRLAQYEETAFTELNRLRSN